MSLELQEFKVGWLAKQVGLIPLKGISSLWGVPEVCAFACYWEVNTDIWDLVFV